MKVEKIIIHHSVTSGNDMKTWLAIRADHIARGWGDIGYHFGIVCEQEWATIVAGRGCRERGAHTVGMNEKSLGVCVVGDFDRKSPTERQYQRCADLCAWLCMAYGLRPMEAIVPHSMFASKTCPGAQFDMKRLVGYADDIYRNWYGMRW